MNEFTINNNPQIIINSSKILFFDDMVVKKDDRTGNIYLGRTTIDKYVIIPEIGENIINLLKNGYTVNKVFLCLRNKYNDLEENDILDFINELIETNFIKNAFDKEYESIQNTSDYGFSFAMKNNTLSRLIFNKYSGFVFIMFSIFTIIVHLFFMDFSILPSYKEYFWNDSLLLVVLVTPIFDIITGFLHEFFHFLASNLFSETSTKFSISHRLLNVVYQTRIKNIWLVPQKYRLLIYLAGLFFDIVLICFFMWGTFLFDRSSIIFKFARFAVLYLEFGIIFQFKFYMKTDVYYFISDVFNRPDLFNDSINAIKGFFIRDKLTCGDRITRVFSLFIICGSFIDIFTTVKYLIPSVRYYLDSIICGTLKIDNFVSIIFLIVYYSILCYSIIRQRKLFL